ncbi:Peroxidase 43 [Morus notabilis]|uniref:Peroxidase n=1 Tax=Morus notabilis TaxID=981085 RepID=W9SBD1_9ROSA|nr:peroxidase 43 [Morus notabilis]EXB97283.1 Peroxidase 43 [Morus notabilis]
MVALILSFIFTLIVGLSEGQLRFNFYAETCPAAESIVRAVVRDAVISNANSAAILLRLHFHDCFVEGCDGSILIDNPNAEKHAFAHQGVGGFDVIERAKAQLEAVCPGVVSCADVVALAARDAIAFARGPFYDVPTGRRDGRVSNLFLANDMPDVHDSVQQLKGKFFRKGLTQKDLVLLSAAHTIGTTACFFVKDRLYNFFPGGGSDPAISPNFLPLLKARCPPNGDVNVRLPIDQGSERTFDSHILQNIRSGFAVLESDAKLREDVETRSIIDSYFGFFNPMFGPFFQPDFVASMVKMGQIGVKTGFQGEIRRTCSLFN